MNWKDKFGQQFPYKIAGVVDDFGHGENEKIIAFIQSTLREELEGVGIEIEKMKHPCMGDPEMLLGMKERFENEGFNKVSTLLQERIKELGV